MPNPLKILFIGINPSNMAATQKAFTPDTASGRLLRKWTEGIDGTFYYENIVPQKTENNRPLKKSEIAHALASLGELIKEINPDRIVALGKSPSETLKKLGIEHLEMPHPSGLNRKLNDPAFTEEKIKVLHLYCSDSNAQPSPVF